LSQVRTVEICLKHYAILADILDTFVSLVPFQVPRILAFPHRDEFRVQVGTLMMRRGRRLVCITPIHYGANYNALRNAIMIAHTLYRLTRAH